MAVSVEANECIHAITADTAHSVSPEMELAGTVLVIIASFTSCLAVNIQKWAHNYNVALPADKRLSMYRSWRWWLGIVTMVSASIMDVVALPFVPMSRVAALGATTLVANVVITPLFLNERLTLHDCMGCIVCVIGTTMACVYGVTREPSLNSQCLLTYLADHLFLSFAFCVAVFLLLGGYLIQGFRLKQLRAIEHGLIGGTGQPDVLESSWTQSNMSTVTALPLEAPYIFINRLGPLFYPAVHASFAGTVGGHSIMLAKAVVIFFRNATAGVDTALSVGYMMLFALPTALCVWGQVHFLNVALKIYSDALFVLPIYQAFWIISGIATGLIFYQEYRRIPPHNIQMFVLGVVTCLVGLYVLAHRKPRGRTAAPAHSPEMSQQYPSADDISKGTTSLRHVQDRAVLLL